MTDILQLSASERISLAHAIRDSIAQIPDAVQVAGEQRRILDRRLGAYYRDPDGGSPWKEVKARIAGTD